MAFPEDWGRKCELVIQVAQVAGALTDFPVLLTKDNLPSEMMDSDEANAALEGGGDIRFTTDEDGTSQIPCEVVSFARNSNPASAAVEIWVKIPSVSGSVDTSFWVWYKKSGETQPAASDPFGSQAVWDSNYLAVLHKNASVTVGNTTPDSTSNGRNFTAVAANLNAVAGSVGNGLDFTSSPYLTKADENPALRPASFTLEIWLKPDATSNFMVVAMKTNGSSWTLGWGLDFRNPNLRFWLNAYNAAGQFAETNPGTSSTRLIQAKYNGTTISQRLDGNSPVTQAYATPINYDTDAVHIGFHSGGVALNGRIDEFRISNVARSDAWGATNWNAQNAPGTFIVEGTPEDVVPAVVLPTMSQILPAGTGKISRARITKAHRTEQEAEVYHNLMAGAT